MENTDINKVPWGHQKLLKWKEVQKSKSLRITTLY